MARGGARNRSGPQANENSGRSDQRGYSLTALPAEGYAGPVPDYPLPPRFQLDDEDGVGAAINERELALWRWLWTTPQACAWSMPSERWRLHTIAMYVRTFVICEGSEATAADKGSLHRFADQIGMTTAGLAEMGWKIAVDETATKRAEKSASSAPAPRKSSRDRMSVVKGGAGSGG